MNKMKKIFALILALALFATTYTVAFAGDNPTINVAKVETYPGETVDVEISLSNNPGITVMALQVDYDKENITLTGITDADVLPSPQHSDDYTADPYQLSWFGFTEKENNTQNGKIVTLKFQVKDTAATKEYPIVVTYDNVNDYSITNCKDERVNFDVVDGSINVTEKPKENFDLSITDGKCTYDGKEHTLKVEGLPEDSDANVDYAVEGPVVDGKAIDVGEYKITATVTKDGYNDWTGTATLKIEPKVVTVKGLTAVSRQYDGTNKATLSGGKIDGIEARDGADKLTYSIPTEGTFEDANVGDSKAVDIPEITLDGCSAGNYTVTQPTGLTANITKAPITIVAKDVTVKVGAELPSFGYDTPVGNLYEEDAVTGKLETDCTSTDAVGVFEITQGSLKVSDNYDLTFIKGKLSVVDKTPQTITVADIAAKTYGDEDFKVTVTPDEASKLDNFTFKSSDTDVAEIDEAGNVTINNAGTTEITVAQAGDEVYAPATVTKELVVAQKDITITAIDLEAEKPTPTFSGVVNGDTVDLDFGKLDVKVTNAEEGKAEVSNFVLTGEKAANYNVANDKVEITVAVTEAPADGVAPNEVPVTVKKAEAAKTVIITSMDTTGFTGETLALDATKAYATVETVQIPKTAFEALKETDTKLEVNLANGTAVFDKQAMEAVAGADVASVSLKISKPDDSRLEDAQVEVKKDLADNNVMIYSFEINDGTIADFEGGIVTVTVAYTKTGNGNIKAKYLKNDGTTENVASVKYDAEAETVTLELSHFSEYVIYTEPQGSKKPSSPGVVANVGIKNNGEEKPAEEVKEPEETKEPEEQTPAAGKFTDVPAWAEKAVENLSNLGIVSGRGEGKFDPNGKVTRAEFAVMIARMFSLDVADGESTFVDCTKDDWFAPHVNAAAKAGFISGVGEGKFNPSATISRQDICTILGRALKVAATKDLSFADSADIAEYANEYVKAFAELGVVSGYENGTFAPKANASRAEAAAILNNVINLDLEVVKEAIAKLTAEVEK